MLCWVVRRRCNLVVPSFMSSVAWNPISSRFSSEQQNVTQADNKHFVEHAYFDLLRRLGSKRSYGTLSGAVAPPPLALLLGGLQMHSKVAPLDLKCGGVMGLQTESYSTATAQEGEKSSDASGGSTSGGSTFH